MSREIHERPGVYSSYDASGAAETAKHASAVGIVAIAEEASDAGTVRISSYAEGVTSFGEDSGMAALLRVLYANGAGEVYARAVEEDADAEDYGAAFAALEQEENVGVVVCDSTLLAVQKALRDSVERAAEARHERVAVVGGGTGESVSALIERAGAINSERVILTAPGALDEDGDGQNGTFCACAVAALLALDRDPSVPINGAELYGLSGLGAQYTDTEIDSLVRGGVTPLVCENGCVSPVRGITTRTKTNGVPDARWREVTTVRTADDVIVSVRNALHSRFARSKNTAQTRAAIRSQVILELENKKTAERIDSYGEVSVCAWEEDPTVCLVEFSFAVAHGLNRIYLTAHITV